MKECHHNQCSHLSLSEFDKALDFDLLPTRLYLLVPNAQPQLVQNSMQNIPCSVGVDIQAIQYVMATLNSTALLQYSYSVMRDGKLQMSVANR